MLAIRLSDDLVIPVCSRNRCRGIRTSNALGLMMPISTEPIVVVLDTSKPVALPSDTGKTQTMKFPFLKLDIPVRLSISLGSGDTVVFEGKSEDTDNFVVNHTWQLGDEIPIDIYTPRIWRVRRTVDGGVGESVVKVENVHSLELEADE